MKILRSAHAQAALWILLVTVLMMLPGYAMPDIGGWFPRSLDEWLDKINHLVVFLVMVVLLSRSLSATGRLRRPVLWAALITFIYAFALETIQVVVPERTWQPADLVADALGVMLALPLATRLASWHPRRA